MKFYWSFQPPIQQTLYYILIIMFAAIAKITYLLDFEIEFIFCKIIWLMTTVFHCIRFWLWQRKPLTILQFYFTEMLNSWEKSRKRKMKMQQQPKLQENNNRKWYCCLWAACVCQFSFVGFSNASRRSSIVEFCIFFSNFDFFYKKFVNANHNTHRILTIQYFLIKKYKTFVRHNILIACTFTNKNLCVILNLQIILLLISLNTYTILDFYYLIEVEKSQRNEFHMDIVVLLEKI